MEVLKMQQSTQLRRAEINAAPWAQAAHAVVRAYRERRVTTTLAVLAKHAGTTDIVRIHGIIHHPFKATSDKLAVLARVAEALGVEGPGPFHKIIPDAVMEEREENARVARLFPPQPKRVNDPGWKRWTEQVEAIAKRERAKRAGK